MLSDIVKKLIYTNALTIPFIFFSVYAIFGLKHLGEEQSLTYWIVALISSLLSLFILFFTIIKSKKISYLELGFFFVPIIVTLLFIYSGNYQDLALQTIMLFLLFSFPAIFIGLELGKNGNIDAYVNFFFMVSLIITLGISLTIPAVMSTPVLELAETFAGGHYQALSYFAAFAFLITVIKWSFYTSKNSIVKTLFFLILIFSQIITIILSGGRGGLVVIVAGAIILFYTNFRRKGFLPFVFFLGTVLFVGLNYFLNYDFGFTDTDVNTGEVQSRTTVSAARLISYIDSGGIDFSQTSNREIYYKQSFEYFLEKPILGHGLFDRIDESPSVFFGRPGFFYPHNFFLEVLIQGGLIYLLFWIIVLSFFALKLYKIIRRNKAQTILLAPFLYSFVQLMFSGTYLQEPFFWFMIAYVFAYPSKFNEIEENPLAEKLKPLNQ